MQSAYIKHKKSILIITGVCFIIAIISYVMADYPFSKTLLGGFVGAILGFFGACYYYKFQDTTTPEQRRKMMIDLQEQGKKQKEEKLAKKRQKYKAKMKCPRCGSQNIHPLSQHRKGFSLTKAAGGTLLAGKNGSLAGFAGKKTNQVDWVCMDCGKTFVK